MNHELFCEINFVFFNKIFREFVAKIFCEMCKQKMDSNVQEYDKKKFHGGSNTLPFAPWAAALSTML